MLNKAEYSAVSIQNFSILSTIDLQKHLSTADIVGSCDPGLLFKKTKTIQPTLDVPSVCRFAPPAGVSVAVKTDALEFKLEIEDSGQQYWTNHENNIYICPSSNKDICIFISAYKYVMLVVVSLHIYINIMQSYSVYSPYIFKVTNDSLIMHSFVFVCLCLIHSR